MSSNLSQAALQDLVRELTRKLQEASVLGGYEFKSLTITVSPDGEIECDALVEEVAKPPASFLSSSEIEKGSAYCHFEDGFRID